MANIQLTKDDIVITFWADPDDYDEIDGSFTDPEDTQLVKDRAADDNEWGWAVVTLVVTWSPFVMEYYDDDGSYDGDYQGFDTLDGVSAEGKRDFMENSGMYEDMIDEALDHLNEKLASYSEEKLVEDMAKRGDFSERELDDLERRYPSLMNRYYDWFFDEDY